MARLAIICNIFFILSLMVMLFKWFKLPDFLSNFIAVLGLEMSPVANICFVLWFLGIKITKKQVELLKWQTIAIVLMLLFQVVLAIV